MLTPDTLAGAGLLAALVVTLVHFLKPFLPSALQGDQRDAATRLLAVALGALGQTAVYLFTAARITRPELGAALALGMGSGYTAILTYHGSVAVLDAVRQVPPPTPPAAATPAPVSKIEQLGQIFPEAK